jgi:UDP-N-acetylglucosamine 2-epimerase
MTKLRVMTVLGTRPEIIRLSRVINKLDEDYDHILVHTGQNYDFELNQIFFEDLGLRDPDFFLDAAKNNFSETVGNIIIKIDKLLLENRPDAVFILGDTNSSLAAIPAKRQKIPIFHMEAGNRCFDQRVPEEINRKIVDHISDINLPYSNIARDYLISEGISPDRIIKVGSPMKEVIDHYHKKIEKSKIMKKLNLTADNFFLVSSHREENIEDTEMFNNLIDILKFLVDQYNCEVIVSTHPRTQKKIDSLNLSIDKKIRFLKPLSFSDYNNLQINAKVVLSDSGTISEESSILNFPALNIREAHERPEAMEEASVMLVGLNVARIKQSLEILKKQKMGKNRTLQIVEDYNVSNVSEKVSRIILSYIDVINKKVWYK